MCEVMPFVLNEKQQYYLFSWRQKTTSHVPLVSPDPHLVEKKMHKCSATHIHFCISVRFHQSMSPAGLSHSFCCSSALFSS